MSRQSSTDPAPHRGSGDTGSTGQSTGSLSPSERALAAATAALNLVESCLLTLVEKGFVTAEEVRGLMDDARLASEADGAVSDVVGKAIADRTEEILRQLDFADVDDPPRPPRNS